MGCRSIAQIGAHRVKALHDLHKPLGALHLLGWHATAAAVGGVKPVAELPAVVADEHREAGIGADKQQSQFAGLGRGINALGTIERGAVFAQHPGQSGAAQRPITERGFDLRGRRRLRNAGHIIMTASDDVITMRTIVDLPDRERAQLDALCRQRGLSRAEAMRQALRLWLSQQQPGHSAVFGLWRDRPEDSMALQQALRAEWSER
jgi:hypothetical protein